MNLKNKITRDFYVLLMALPILGIPWLFNQELVDQVTLPRVLALTGWVGLAAGLRLIWPGEERMGMWRRPLTWAGLAWLGWTALSLWWSPLQAEGLFETLRAGLFFAFMLLLAGILAGQERPFRLLSKIYLLLTLFMAWDGIVQIIQLLDAGTVTHHLMYYVKGSFAHKNLFSQMFLYSLPWSVFGLIVFRKGWRILAGLAGLFGLAGSILLMTRGVWVSLFGAGLVALVLLLMHRKELMGEEWAKRIRPIPAFGGLAVLLIVVPLSIYLIKPDIGQTMWKTSRAMGNLGHGSPQERIGMWKASLKMTQKAPLSGIGAGSWRRELPQYGLENYRYEAQQGEHHFQRPHNDYLWVLAETGIPGFLLYLAMFAFAAWQFFQTLRKGKDRERRLLAWLMLFGLLAWMGTSFFSFPKERVGHSIALHVLFAVALILPEGRETNWDLRSGQVRILSLLILCLAGGTLFVSVNRLRGDLNFHRGLQARAAAQPREVLFRMGIAESPYYRMDPTGTPLAWYRGEAYFVLGSLDSAKTEFEQALALHPHHLHILNNYGATLTGIGQPELALPHYQHALKMSPEFEEGRYNLAALHFNAGRSDSAWKQLSLIPEDYGNQRYDHFVEVVTREYVHDLLGGSEDSLVLRVIRGMEDEADWRLKMHQKAIMDHLSYRYQVMLDVIYILESVEKSVNLDCANELRDELLLEKP